MTKGEIRTRTEFNPSKITEVDLIKQDTASLINRCQGMMDATEDPEVRRLAALAQTAYEEAAMWAVKAATA